VTSRLDDLLIGREPVDLDAAPSKEPKRIWTPQKLSEAEAGALKGGGKNPDDYVALPIVVVEADVTTGPGGHYVRAVGGLALGTVPALLEPGVMDSSGQRSNADFIASLGVPPQIRLVVHRDQVSEGALAEIDEVVACHGLEVGDPAVPKRMRKAIEAAEGSVGGGGG